MFKVYFSEIKVVDNLDQASLILNIKDDTSLSGAFAVAIVGFMESFTPETRVGFASRIDDIGDSQKAIVMNLGVHNPSSKRFDWHQLSGSDRFRSKDDDSRYGLAGLIWKAFGRTVLKRIYPTQPKEILDRVYQLVDIELFRKIDRIEISSYAILLIDLFEMFSCQKIHETQSHFAEAAEIAGKFLYREIEVCFAKALNEYYLDEAIQKDASNFVLVHYDYPGAVEWIVRSKLPNAKLKHFYLVAQSDGRVEINVISQCLCCLYPRVPLPNDEAVIVADNLTDAIQIINEAELAAERISLEK